MTSRNSLSLYDIITAKDSDLTKKKKKIVGRTVWTLRKFTFTHFWQKCRESNGITQCNILRNSLSHKSAQNLTFFRETNLLIAHKVKHFLGNSNFDQFGANLRKNGFSKSKR